MLRTRRYSIEIKRSPDGLLALSVAADWNNKERSLAFAEIMRMSQLPCLQTRLYWIEVRDQNGVLLLFNTMDWTEEGKCAGLAKICRLAGLPDAIDQQGKLTVEV